MMDMSGWNPLIEQVRARYGVKLEANNTGGNCYRFEGRLEGGSWIIALPNLDFVGEYESDVTWQDANDYVRACGNGLETSTYDWLVFQSPNCVDPECVEAKIEAHPACQQADEAVTYGVLLTGSKPHQLPDSIALGLQAISRKLAVAY